MSMDAKIVQLEVDNPKYEASLVCLFGWLILARLNFSYALEIQEDSPALSTELQPSGACRFIGKSRAAPLEETRLPLGQRMRRNWISRERSLTPTLSKASTKKCSGSIEKCLIGFC